MITTLMILALLISSMFMASIASTVAEPRRESEDRRDFARRHSAFR